MKKLTSDDYIKWNMDKNKTRSSSLTREDYLVEKINELIEEIEKLKNYEGCGKCSGK